jgi:hypothetical protein
MSATGHYSVRYWYTIQDFETLSARVSSSFGPVPVIVVLYCVSYYGRTFLHVPFRGSHSRPVTLRYGMLPF